jgi:hypothetical protein
MTMPVLNVSVVAAVVAALFTSTSRRPETCRPSAGLGKLGRAGVDGVWRPHVSTLV